MTEQATTNGIVAALVEFQKEMPVVGKDALNPHFKSRYADLATLTKEILPILNKHGLIYVVTPMTNGESFEVIGTLMHTSGQRIDAALPLFGRTSQEIGSALTYARRYLLGCLTGVVTDEDDDGNAASKMGVTRTRSVPGASKEQIDTIVTYMQKVNIPEVFEQVLGRIATAADITAEEAAKVITHLENMPHQESA